VRASALGRAYGDLVALRDVSFELPAGATLTVLGPNGSGKTTLVRVLATLLRPTEGQVEVLDAELPRQAWRARGRIGLMGHEPLLYRDLTIAENLAFHARLHGVDGAAERIGELLAAVPLERRAGDAVRNLSAGSAQRAGVVRARLPPAATAAGGRALTRQPAGARTLTGANAPPEAGRSGAVRQRTT